jgi:hypothetical protein
VFAPQGVGRRRLDERAYERASPPVLAPNVAIHMTTATLARRFISSALASTVPRSGAVTVYPAEVGERVGEGRREVTRRERRRSR